MRVVISQPMFFPWLGFLEQVRLADVFVRYDDVQFSKGSFTNRVQYKTETGVQWLTVPLSGFSLGQRIDEVQVDSRGDWKVRHRAQLAKAYVDAPHRADMLALLDEVYARDCDTIAEISWLSLQLLCEYFKIGSATRFVDIGELAVAGSGSQRVLDIVKTLGGSHYVTGWGARSYLNHEAFEQSGVQVEYMDYQKPLYPQLHGAFTPFVSSLDLVANLGVRGVDLIQPSAIPWREFLKNE